MYVAFIVETGVDTKPHETTRDHTRPRTHVCLGTHPGTVVPACRLSLPPTLLPRSTHTHAHTHAHTHSHTRTRTRTRARTHTHTLSLAQNTHTFQDVIASRWLLYLIVIFIFSSPLPFFLKVFCPISCRRDLNKNTRPTVCPSYALSLQNPSPSTKPNACKQVWFLWFRTKHINATRMFYAPFPGSVIVHYNNISEFPELVAGPSRLYIRWRLIVQTCQKNKK